MRTLLNVPLYPRIGKVRSCLTSDNTNGDKVGILLQLLFKNLPENV